MVTLALPVLHGRGAYPDGFLNSDWALDPTVVLGVFALIAAYVAWTGPVNRRRPDVAQRPVSRRQRLAFLSGALVLLIALSPPLDDWADAYLLSAHMVQHMLLMFVVAPLWLIGTPSWLLAPLLQRPIIARAGYYLTRPASAWVIANLIIVVWHLPGPYDAALRSEPLHALQHLTFLGAALLGWWPVLSPLPAWPRLALPLQCLYLFLFGMPGGIVGAFVTLASPGLYSFYVDAPRLWGISLEDDQVAAGLLMWVGGSVIYLVLITIIFFQWAAREEDKERAARQRLSTVGKRSAGTNGGVPARSAFKG